MRSPCQTAGMLRRASLLLVTCSIRLAAPVNAGPYFDAPFRGYPIGGRISAACLFDYDSDGRQEVVLAEEDSSAVDVCRVAPDGVVSVIARLPVAGKGRAVTAADFNNDGLQDLAVGAEAIQGSQGVYNVTILTRAGSGFTRLDVPLYNSVNALTVGDFDEDGDADLALGLYGGILILINSSSNFVPGAGLGGGNTTAIVSADLDSDGHLDLFHTFDAVSPFGNQQICYGNGLGGFVSQPMGDRAKDAAVGDLNSDGRTDVVTVHWPFQGATEAWILFNNGGGSYSTQTLDFGNGLATIAVADVNGDGLVDLVGANNGAFSNTITVRLQLEGGGFGGPQASRTAHYPARVLPLDYDSDARLDLAVPYGYWTGNLAVMRGAGNGAFAGGVESPTPQAPRGVSVGDANSDAYPDLVVPSSVAHTVSIFTGGASGFLPHASVSVYSPIRAALVDVNGDGNRDLVALNDNNFVAQFRGHPGGRFDPPQTFGLYPSPRDWSLADLNEDTRPDVIVVGAGQSPLNIMLTDSNGLTDTVYFPSGTPLQCVETGDVNGDGHVDLVTSGTTTELLLGNGDGTIGAPATVLPNQFSSIHLADLDADGHLDIVGMTPTSVAVFASNGAGAFAFRSQRPTGDDARFVEVGDLNGDGLPDVATSEILSNTVSIYLNGGYGMLWPRAAFGTGDGPYGFALGDWNLDGRQDIAVACIYSSTMTILHGIGAVTDVASGAFDSQPLVCYPNPTWGRTVFGIFGTAARNVAIYDAAGRLVRSLGITRGATGTTWDLLDGRGLPVSSGVYYCRLVGTTRRTKLAVVR